MNHFFISYAREDSAHARGLADLLQSEGFTVWWDPYLRMGEKYPELIRQEIRRCHHVIVLWSAHSVTSDWVRWEARTAKEMDKILPVQLDDCEIPHGFKTIHTVQFKGWPDLVQELYKTVGGGGFSMPSYARHARPPLAHVPDIADEPPSPPSDAEDLLRKLGFLRKDFPPPRRHTWRWTLFAVAVALLLAGATYWAMQSARIGEVSDSVDGPPPPPPPPTP